MAIIDMYFVAIMKLPFFIFKRTGHKNGASIVLDRQFSRFQIFLLRKQRPKWTLRWEQFL